MRGRCHGLHMYQIGSWFYAAPAAPRFVVFNGKVKSMPLLIHIQNFIPRSGRSSDHYLYCVAKRLSHFGWRTHHVLAGTPDPWFLDRLAEVKSSYQLVRFPLSIRDAWRLGKQLRPHHPDIIQIAFVSKFSPAYAVLKWVSGAKHLVCADKSSGGAPTFGAVKRFLARCRAWMVATYLDRIVAISEFVRRRNVEGVFFPESKTRLVYNGINVDQFKPADDSQELGYDADDTLCIAFAGQLIPEKGVRTLLGAFHDLVRKCPQRMRLKIAGQGPQQPELERLCSHNGLTQQVDFLGQIDWVDKLFSEADIVVVPSEWEEAFGFVVAEGMAAGAAVIGSDAGGIPEIIGTDGEAGFIFRRGNAAELSEKLLTLATDASLRQRMGARARERVLSRFTIDRMVEGYLGVYLELLGDENVEPIWAQHDSHTTPLCPNLNPQK